MAFTIVEKILSRHAGQTVRAGQTISASVDVVMATDGSGPLTVDFFQKMQGDTSFDPARVLMIPDHYVPCPNDKVAGLHSMMQDFCDKGFGTMFELGEGICHQLLPEKGYVRPGRLIIGGDSHSTTYGALNALGAGVGSSDLAAAIISGGLWLRVPSSIRVTLKGRLADGVTAKDAALDLVGRIGASGAAYKAVEFAGDIAFLSISERMTLCNLMAETGAKFAVMPGDDATLAFLTEKGIACTEADLVTADADAVYEQEVLLDLSTLEPRIAAPHTVDNVKPLAELAGTRIHMGVLGTCTNGRLEDLEEALKVMGERPLFPGFQLLVIPASRSIYAEASRRGILAALAEKGAQILPPGCGPCCGSSPGIPRNGWNVLSTANRNFIGRMGNVTSGIYLGSPASVAAAAVTGRICDARSLSDRGASHEV